MTIAVDDISFEVNEGEIFRLLGPNGASKTTTVECTGRMHRWATALSARFFRWE